jgi:hypothetical protein
MNWHFLVSFGRACVAASIFSCAGCGDGEDGSPEPTPADGELQIEIAGTWESNFGVIESISSEGWGDAAIVAFDNGDNFAITQNADDAAFSPGLFNRNVWTEPANGSFYYCTVAFGLESEEAALESTATADASDPENSGCGGAFAWTKLSAQ